jgi:glucose/mannose transport system substrate-binding protein
MRDPCPEPVRRAWMLRAAGLAVAATGGAWAQPVQRTSPDAPEGNGAKVPPVEVLHWWASASERLAVDALTQLVNHPQHLWRHAVVPGGTSAGALTVLRARLLRGDPPHFAHLHARSLRELAGMGAMLDLSHSTEVLSRWHTCEPLAREAVTWQGQVVGVPIGLHRGNTMLVNLAVWRALSLPPVRTWDDVERIAPQLTREGILPLVWSDAGNHLLPLFESLLVATHRAEGHRTWLDALEGTDARDAWTSRPVRDALERLRQLRSLQPHNPGPTPGWARAGKDFLLGRAALWVGGDWTRGEVRAWGMRAELDHGFQVAPDTGDVFLCVVDCLGAFAAQPRHRFAQAQLAARLLEPDAQAAFNRAKGSLPPQTVGAFEGEDIHQVRAWVDLHNPRVLKLPSLVHRLGMSGLRLPAIGQWLQRYATTPSLSAVDLQQQLARLSLSRTP